MSFAQASSRPLAGRPGHNRGLSFPPEPLTSAEVAAIMSAFNRGATGDRNRALVAVLYRAGLRLSEALALKLADVDPRAGSIRVLRGKGRKARTASIDDGGLRFVERWMARRIELGLSGRQPLFCQLDGSAWSPQAVRGVLAYAAAKTGVTKRVHPHGFRHTHAVELAREGVPVSTIQRQLGHSSLATTSVYLDHLSPADVLAVGRARTWPGVETPLPSPAG